MKKESFTKIVQTSKIKHPTQMGFSVKKWKTEFDSCKEQNIESDTNLFQAGLYFFEHLNSIRSNLSRVNDNLISIDKLRRSYIGIVNRDYLVANNAMKENFKEMSGKKELAIMGTISEKSLPIGPFGNDVHIFGAIEGHIDAVRYPLSDTFSNTRNNINRKIDDLDFLDMLSFKINLAAMYQTISELWGECLWNQWKVDSKDDFDLITPPDSNRFKCKIITEHRSENLQAESAYHWHSIWENLSNDKKQALNKKK